jgi:type I restriction enzyme S subunit
MKALDKRIEIQRKLIDLYKSLIKTIKTLEFSKQIDFKYQKLIDICDITTGKLNANAMVENGKYDFFTCSKENYKTDTYAFDCEALLIAGNGEVGLTKYFNGKFNAYQRTYVLKNFKLNAKYLKLYLDFKLIDYLRSKTNSSAMSYITLGTLSSLPIRLIDENRQESFVANIEKIETLYFKLEQELFNLEIVKRQLLKKLFI